MRDPEFSVVIPSYERHESLRRLLQSIHEHFGEPGTHYEVIVVNNARDERARQAIDDVVGALRERSSVTVRLLREPCAGKCRAQNLAIRHADGAILAFFDDDVVVAPGWLSAAARFFRTRAHDAMQGPILVPPEMINNKEFLDAQYKFRTINFVKYSPRLIKIKTLTGANMAVRREVFARVGCFNEELGPGRSGISEDVEFAKRLLRSGGTIGYEPQAAVYHEVDWSRLTEAFFRCRHEQQGRSRLIYAQQTLASIIPNLVRAVCTYGWYSLNGDVRKQYRAKGRCFHYRAMFVEKARRMKNANP
jgi:GT2 family glycosyltransferase